MRFISEDIKKAIRQAVNKYDSQAELARQCRIHKSYIHHYLSGRVKNITLENWQKLYSHIRDFLPPEHEKTPEFEFLREIQGKNFKGTPYEHLKNPLDTIPKELKILMKEWEYLTTQEKNEVIDLVLGRSSKNKLAEAKSAAGE